MTFLYRPVFEETVEVPVSKSELIRYIILSCFADSPVRILCNTSGFGEDIQHALKAAGALGAAAVTDASGINITPAQDVYSLSSPVIVCGESATLMRLLQPLVTDIYPDAVFGSVGTLKSRVNSDMPVFSGSYRELPLVCDSGSRTSQYISGFIIRNSLRSGAIKAEGAPVSRPYIGMTLALCREFGARIETDGNIYYTEKPQRYFTPPKRVEAGGDWSCGAFLLAAGLVGERPVSVRGLSPDSVQGDRAILDILRDMGGNIRYADGIYTAYPSSPLRPVATGLSDTPDLFPVLAAAAAYADGTSVFTDISALKYKESDRLHSMLSLLRDCGTECSYSAGTGEFTVTGGRISGGNVRLFSDHRIAMAAVLLSLGSEAAVAADDISCISKTFPGFLKSCKYS